MSTHRTALNAGHRDASLTAWTNDYSVWAAYAYVSGLLLKEDGDHLLMEDGAFIQIEAYQSTPAMTFRAKARDSNLVARVTT